MVKEDGGVFCKCDQGVGDDVTIQIWTDRGGTLQETCLRVSFLSPITAIFAACYLGCASPLHYPFSSCTVTLLVSISTIGVRSFFFECLSIDDIILIHQQVFGDFGSRCCCFSISSYTFHSSGRLCFFALGVTIVLDIAQIQPHSQHTIIAYQLFQPSSSVIGVPLGVRPRRSCCTTFAIVR